MDCVYYLGFSSIDSMNIKMHKSVIYFVNRNCANNIKTVTEHSKKDLVQGKHDLIQGKTWLITGQNMAWSMPDFCQQYNTQYNTGQKVCKTIQYSTPILYQIKTNYIKFLFQILTIQIYTIKA